MVRMKIGVISMLFVSLPLNKYEIQRKFRGEEYRAGS